MDRLALKFWMMRGLCVLDVQLKGGFVVLTIRAVRRIA